MLSDPSIRKQARPSHPKRAPGCLRGRSPARTCRNIHADRCARLRRTIPPSGSPTSQHPPFPRPWCGPPNRTPLRASCSTRRFHAQAPVPSALAARLPPHSPPNPTFALLAEHRGLPVTRPAEHAQSHADLEFRCIMSLAARQPRQSACETPSDRSLRGASRRSDGTATTLRSSRADLAVFRGCHAFGTSMRRGGCAGRSYPSHSLEKSPDMVGGRRKARASRAHPTSSWHWSWIGMGLRFAQKVLAKSGILRTVNTRPDARM